MTKKSLFIFLLLLSLNLCSCSSFISERNTAAVSQIQCLPVFPDKDGWYGGDGAYSIKLDGERTLWLFGDTFAASEENRKDRIDMKVILGTTLAISTCSGNNEFNITSKRKTENLNHHLVKMSGSGRKTLLLSMKCCIFLYQ